MANVNNFDGDAKKYLNKIKMDAILSRGDHRPIPVSAITQTYLIVKPLIDSIKTAEIDRDGLMAVYEFYMMMTFICDYTQKQTVDEAKGLLQRRKEAIFDGGVVIMRYIKETRNGARYKATGNDLSTIHAGYIAACEVFENSTVSAYKAAKAEINELEISGATRIAKRARRVKRANRRR